MYCLHVNQPIGYTAPFFTQKAVLWYSELSNIQNHMNYIDHIYFFFFRKMHPLLSSILHPFKGSVDAGMLSNDFLSILACALTTRSNDISTKYSNTS